MGVRPHGNTKRPCQAEIRKLEVVSLVDQQVLWLQVAMQDPVRMTVKKPRTELVSEFLTMSLSAIVQGVAVTYHVIRRVNDDH